jgi:hypothetical protein
VRLSIFIEKAIGTLILKLLIEQVPWEISQKSVARQDAELQAIPWMDQPAQAPVGSGFFGLSPRVAADAIFRMIAAICLDV